MHRLHPWRRHLCLLSFLALLLPSVVAAAPDDFVFDLGGERFDPLVTDPATRFDAGWQTRSAGPASADLRLIQFDGPVRQAWLDDLADRGVEPLQYVHPYGYIVWGTGAALESPTAGMRWQGDFLPGYRLLPRWRALSAAPIRVGVLIVARAGTDAVIDALARRGASRATVRPLDHRFAHAVVTVAGDRLAELAAVPGVYSVQPRPTDGGLRSEMSGQINVNNHDASNVAFPGYQAWLTAVGLSGAGVRMANVDGGVQESHPDLVSRMVGCSGTTCSSSSSGHGTHTAGIMAGDGGSGITDGDGFLRGLGVAPGAELFEQRYSPFFNQAGGMLLIIRDSYANGAVLSNNSWGPAGSPRGYDDDTMQVDIGVRDADPNAAGDQSFTYVLSFMNGGGGTSSQGTPDEAKNLFNIGSTKMRFSSGNQDTNIDDVSANSAHGPALDGRTIPHMVAPGCRVDSTVPTDDYGLSCGTSMASPQVSGGVALFFERYRGLFGSDPSPALVKAAFLPVAHNLAGFDDADGGTLGHPFDSKQGWGRMDLEAVVDPALPVRYWDNPILFDATDDAWSVTVQPADADQPMRFMLVWTDAPGHGLGGSTPAWNNDLDLVVESAGDTFLGNVFGADGFSISGGSADDRNNTEGVFLASPSAQVTVRVRAADINSDGVPGSGDLTDQDFALVCYNCDESVLFADTFESGDLTLWSEIVVP
ncbi:MAG: S8 family serine peptidase [Acidobacteriota bacterium]